MKQQYYRVEDAGLGAYDFDHDGTVLVIRGDNCWLLTDEWCGSGIEGECYRNHVNDLRKKWPKAADGAEDMVAEYKKYFDALDFPVYPSEIGPQKVREILGV